MKVYRLTEIREDGIKTRQGIFETVSDALECLLFKTGVAVTEVEALKDLIIKDNGHEYTYTLEAEEVCITWGTK